MSIINWANVLSWLRLVLVVPITAAVLMEWRVAIVVLGLLAGATDMIDGAVARRTAVASSRGAALDSNVDAAMMLGMVAWLGMLEPALFRAYQGWVAALIAIQVVVMLLVRRRLRVLSGLHLWSGKLGLTLGYALLASVAARGAPPWLIHVVIAASLVASIEALAYVGKGGRNLEARFFWDP
jgi:phosphatidylglycerophosphate synthase